MSDAFPKFLRGALAAMLLLAALAGGSRPAAMSAQGGAAPEPGAFSDRYPAAVRLQSRAQLQVLNGLRVEIDGVRTDADGTLVVTVWVNAQESAALQAAGFTAVPVPNESLAEARLYGPGIDSPNAWPSYDQFVARMRAISDTYPSLVRMLSIGTSVQGRALWALKITDNPDAEEDEPEVKYSAAIHGDETVGIEMEMRLAELLTSQYGVDPQITALVDGEEIWLIPFSNPDGYVASTRYNAHGVDLNRHFPDMWIDPNDDPTGREPEIQAFMYFGYAHRFTMGINYHGGAQVVNYPYDGCQAQNCYAYPAYAPDNDLFYYNSVGYAARNPYILGGGFTNGVTVGWEWYDIYGGMQDWAYHWRHEHHVTIELSDVKKPAYETMNAQWDANRDAMLWWAEQALQGVRGLVTDAATGLPLDATVNVTEIGEPVRTDPDAGDYHRLLLPGSYTLSAHADGYCDQSAPVTVISGTATIQNFVLAPGPVCTTVYKTYLPLHAWQNP